MALNFDNKIPEWKNEGAEPSEDLKTKGFKGGYKPPAAVFNWFWCLVQKCINELQTLLKDHAEDTNNPHGTTKTHVGLGNADNTADSDKKVLSATKLTTARKINDVAFNGTKDITVTANPTLNKLAEGTDLNDVKAIGFYKAGNESITNTPSGVGSFSLVVSGIGGAGYVQELYDFNTRAKYIRHTTSATAWAGWIKLAVNSDVESINTELAKTLKSQGTVISEDTKWTQLEQGIYEVALDNGWSDTNTTTPNNYNSNIPSDGALIVFKAINSESSASKIVQIYVPIDNGLIVRRTRQFTGTWSSWLPITYGHTHNEYAEKSYSVQYYKCLTNIANGLDVYDGIKSNTTNEVTIKCNSNYRVGNSFCVIFENIDLFRVDDIVLYLTYNSADIASGAIYDSNENSITVDDLSADVLYKITIRETGGFKIEQFDADTICSIDTDRQLNTDNVFFVEFKNSANVSNGIKLKANYDGTNVGPHFIYDTDGKKITSVETNKLYPFKRTADGFKMMKMGS